MLKSCNMFFKSSLSNFKTLGLSCLIVKSQIIKFLSLSGLFFIIPLLNSQNTNTCGRILRLFYRFFTSCDDVESVEQMKNTFAESEGLDLVEELLDDEEIGETAQNVLDLFKEEE